jgi:hypothetical protein
MPLTLTDAWYLLAPIGTAVGGFALGIARPARRSAPDRDKLYPLPLVTLRPLDMARWAELAAELNCPPGELIDYSQRIAQFIARELRWGGIFLLERPYARPLVLIFDRFVPIVGTDIPPAPMPPESLLPGAEEPQPSVMSHGTP